MGFGIQGSGVPGNRAYRIFDSVEVFLSFHVGFRKLGGSFFDGPNWDLPIYGHSHLAPPAP